MIINLIKIKIKDHNHFLVYPYHHTKVIHLFFKLKEKILTKLNQQGTLLIYYYSRIKASCQKCREYLLIQIMII
jgi:hypothetical protein